VTSGRYDRVSFTTSVRALSANTKPFCAAQEERVYEEQLRETHHNVRVAHVQDAFSHGGGSRDSARRVFVAPPARDVHLEGAGFPEPGATQDAPARRRQRGGDPNRKRERQHANRRTRKQGAEPADA